ncbi:uncharacterized protein ZK632.12-like [Cololabis saira]|uniref:uncharacterized protein ZK632.12-like n=1 Tax=Cololabis saira TaxID=129043 RepID=UPI002AD3659B|nr:uncharacterized protein ZK632.12-like [Cololabis saira]
MPVHIFAMVKVTSHVLATRAVCAAAVGGFFPSIMSPKLQGNQKMSFDNYDTSANTRRKAGLHALCNCKSTPLVLSGDHNRSALIREGSSEADPGSGKCLLSIGDVLVQTGSASAGRGHPEEAGVQTFFLFNDVLVDGSIIRNGCWFKTQIEDLKLEDMVDGVRFQHQWLICTPCKSFIVAAQSYEEKQAWMKLISDSQSSLVQDGSCKPSSVFAVCWIPEDAAQK